MLRPHRRKSPVESSFFNSSADSTAFSLAAAYVNLIHISSASLGDVNPRVPITTQFSIGAFLVEIILCRGECALRCSKSDYESAMSQPTSSTLMYYLRFQVCGQPPAAARVIRGYTVRSEPLPT